MEQIKLKSDVFSILKDKIQLIQKNERAIYLVGPIQLPVNLDGETTVFQWYCWLNYDQITEDYEEIIKKLASSNLADFQQSSVLVYGDFANAENALIRMHSICHTGDIFGSKRCDCGFQLKESMKRIKENGAGALFYLSNHEGRGIGLFSKAMAYLLQENGYDTVEANEALGFVNDSRDYDDAILVLKKLRNKSVTLITNNPKKLEALEKAGLPVSGRTPLWGDVSEYNRKYLQTKVTKSGHLQAEGNCFND
ncbi:MAG: GTP cyclohydrolase II [Bacillota bacterium]|uniref:GTP cyclohydrolase II n=1 Tax=Virgibacillus salarius TaxID=447199 RepID=A0A941DW81_9BACI|nr:MULTISPECIES: GTP cyclohydrolase II [Bacillaceae]NAZ09191.1 GTP cyclohydrolase II RibA [Agaribacter marinus]MBR7796482.1 GTP cyclohydrolase II [Virgibacillus salarius]MCC2249530.1 GTP cyclohydrolase II [Virgibacillus sp. AGTR]MDY7044474.1 GTP cyclohydrolase II [Virgibacillus sp. M23]QRZ19390.1 GTP cyclohydrolase II [Virgibacillus sp. AGTR]